MSSKPSDFSTSSNLSVREQDPTGRGTWHIIRSSPFTEQDWAEATQADAAADEWDEAEYARQMRVHLMKVYEGRLLMDLRRDCKQRGLRVRGNKAELVERLAEDDVQRIYGRVHG